MESKDYERHCGVKFSSYKYTYLHVPVKTISYPQNILFKLRYLYTGHAAIKPGKVNIETLFSLLLYQNEGSHPHLSDILSPILRL
jgi:hypothetical protein